MNEHTSKHTDEQTIKPARTVGFWGNSLIQINGMIGSGIFALPAVLFAAVGSFAPVMIVLGGLLTLPLALVFARLAARFDETGGPILYGKVAFGSFAGFQAGWGRYASGLVALAANTHVMVSYFAAIFPVLEGPIAAGVTVIATILIITFINVLGMRSSVNTLGGLTILKLVPLGILVLAGAFGSFTSQAILLPEFSEAETVILLTFYAFIGFEAVTVPAGEMRDPKRDLPRVLVTVLAGVTVLYALVIWAYMMIAPTPTGNENALAGAANIAFGEIGTVMIVLGAGFSILANNFASLIVVPRMAYGMAEQGMMPAWFARVSPRYRTPANAMISYGLAAALFSLAGGFAVLAAASTLARLLTYVITAAALPVIERREGQISANSIVLSILALAATVFIGSHASQQAWITFAGLVAVGTLLYFVAGRQKPISETEAA